MENIQLHPTRKMVIPNDRGSKRYFALSEEDYKDYIYGKYSMSLIEMRKHPKYGKINTTIIFLINLRAVAEDLSLTEVLGRFDNDVANVCISEWAAGNRYVTYSTIYRTLTGKVGESDANPSKVQLAAIKHSLKKLMNLKLDIYFYDACEKLGYNNGKKIHIKEDIIPARFVDCKVNGQKTTVIELTAESPLLTIARLKNNQIISYDVELLNIPKQKNTPLNIALKHYAIRRVMETKAHPRQMTPSITFADVLEKCRINEADNNKKYRVRESLKAVFEHLLACGEIDSFQVNKKNGMFYSISFTFSKEKKPKVEQPNKIAKKVESKPIKKTSSKQEKKTDKTAKTEEASVEWRPLWALAISQILHWKYQQSTLEIMKYYHANSAINPTPLYTNFFPL